VPTKTEFIRSQPLTTSTEEVIAAAKKAGYKTTKQQIYQVRWAMQQKKKKTKPNPVAPVAPVVTVKKVSVTEPLPPIPPEVIKLVVRYGSEVIERAIASLSNGGAGRTP